MFLLWDNFIIGSPVSENVCAWEAAQWYIHFGSVATPTSTTNALEAAVRVLQIPDRSGSNNRPKNYVVNFENRAISSIPNSYELSDTPVTSDILLPSSPVSSTDMFVTESMKG